MTYDEIEILRDKFLDKGYGSCVYNIDRKGVADFGLLIAKQQKSEIIEEIETILDKGSRSQYDNFFVIAEIIRKIMELKGE